MPTVAQIEMFRAYRLGVVGGRKVVRSHKVSQRSSKRYAHGIFAGIYHVRNIRRGVKQQLFLFAVYFYYCGLPSAAYLQSAAACGAR